MLKHHRCPMPAAFGRRGRNCIQESFEEILSEVQDRCCWCREGDLNPHNHFWSADFKSAASANFAIPACLYGLEVCCPSGLLPRAVKGGIVSIAHSFAVLPPCAVAPPLHCGACPSTRPPGARAIKKASASGGLACTVSATWPRPESPASIACGSRRTSPPRHRAPCGR